MQRELKIWGERWLIHKDSTHAVSYLKVKAKYRCSWHSHREKYNLFVVLKGTFKVLVEELGEVREVLLGAGNSYTTKPGQWHEFQAMTDCEVIEEMYVSYSESDIDRKNKGGKINE